MKYPQRRLYENNRLGYLLMLVFIAGNALYAVIALNRMPATNAVGLLVMVTIALFLLGFLTAVKVRAYSRRWSYGALLIALFQTVRAVVALSASSAQMVVPTTVFLLGSAVACLVAGVASTISARERLRTLRSMERPV